MRKDRDLLAPAAKFPYILSYATDGSRLLQIGSAPVWRWQTLESSCPDWSEPVWQCEPLALADAAPAVHVGGCSSLMRAAPLPRCTVTGVVTVVSLPRVLGVPAVKPAVRLWALGTAWVRTSFGVIAEMVAVRGLSNIFFNLKVFIKE